MPFIRSEKDVERLKAVLRRPTFSGVHSIAATFTTDPETIERLLPRPLIPTEPIARVWIADIQASNVAGSFAGAGLDVAAAYAGKRGWYSLFMPMSTDTAVQVGRETLGEPKKLCEIRLERDGETIRGTVGRLGVTLMALTFIPGGELDPMEQDDVRYHFKYLLACDGAGYDAPPKLIEATHHLRASRVTYGSASIQLASSIHDAVAEVPVIEYVNAMYVEGEDVVQARVAADVEPEAFLPWAYANTDDWLVFAEVQKRVHGLSTRNRA